MKGKDGRPVLDKDGNPVPVPEKTWIQQNWYFLIPVGMVVRDLLPLDPQYTIHFRRFSILCFDFSCERIDNVRQK